MARYRNTSALCHRSIKPLQNDSVTALHHYNIAPSTTCNTATLRICTITTLKQRDVMMVQYLNTEVLYRHDISASHNQSVEDL